MYIYICIYIYVYIDVYIYIYVLLTMYLFASSFVFSSLLSKALLRSPHRPILSDTLIGPAKYHQYVRIYNSFICN